MWGKQPNKQDKNYTNPGLTQPFIVKKAMDFTILTTHCFAIQPLCYIQRTPIIKKDYSMKSLFVFISIITLSLSLSGCNDSMLINCDKDAYGKDSPGCGILVWLN